MPSSPNYVRKYKQEAKTETKRRKAQGDPTKKGTRARSARNKLRDTLGLKVGDKRHAGHSGKKKLVVTKKGTTGGKGRAQGAKSNTSAGGKRGNVAGKARGGRKSRRA